jgi:hypothetical protein
MKPEYVMMSPAEAERLLRNNSINRKMRPVYVNYLVKQIEAGNWVPTTSAIGIRDDGTLVNGQHRLAAIARSGKTLPVLFVKGVDEKAFMVEDRGIIRTMSDVTGLNNDIIADANLICLLSGNSHFTRVPESEVIGIIKWWRTTFDALILLHPKRTRGLANSSVRVGYGARWAATDTLEAREYIEKSYVALMSGDIRSMSAATSQLWKRLIQDKIGTGDRAKRIAAAGVVYYATNPARANATLDMRSAKLGKDEMRDTLAKMPAAYAAAPQNALHPYNFAGKAARPAKLDRKAVMAKIADIGTHASP